MTSSSVRTISSSMIFYSLLLTSVRISACRAVAAQKKMWINNTQFCLCTARYLRIILARTLFVHCTHTILSLLFHCTYTIHNNTTRIEENLWIKDKRNRMTFYCDYWFDCINMCSFRCDCVCVCTKVLRLWMNLDACYLLLVNLFLMSFSGYHTKHAIQKSKNDLVRRCMRAPFSISVYNIMFDGPLDSVFPYLMAFASPSFYVKQFTNNEQFVFYVPIVTHSQSERSFSFYLCVGDCFDRLMNYIWMYPTRIQNSSSIECTQSTLELLLERMRMCYYQNHSLIVAYRDVRVRSNVYVSNRHLFVDNTDPMYMPNTVYWIICLFPFVLAEWSFRSKETQGSNEAFD